MFLLRVRVRRFNSTVTSGLRGRLRHVHWNKKAAGPPRLERRRAVAPGKPFENYIFFVATYIFFNSMFRAFFNVHLNHKFNAQGV